MDLNRDELRRQVRESEAANREATRRLRDVLQRWFGGGDADGTPSTDAKAALLGVPSPGRRQLFAMGGAAVVGAAALAACGDDGEDAAETGATTATTSGATTNGGAELDVVLARTAASVELLAVDAYQAAIDSGVVTTAAVADAATRFQSHHRDHAGVLNATVREAGGEEVTTANPFLLENLVATADLSSELAVVRFARSLEDAAASTYVYAAGELSAPELRQAIMAIGGVEARHVTALDLALQALGAGAGPAFEDGGFTSPDRRIPDEALLV